jgi:hypothetical protein
MGRSLQLLVAVVIAAHLGVAPAEAQTSVGLESVEGPVGPDDVAWESRREPWNGAPVRPGGELDGRINGWVWVGTAALVGGYALSFVGLDPRAGSIIPLVGPWLSIAGVFDEEPWQDGQTVAMIASGILQAGGILGIVLGLLNPRYFVIYDAPVGSPPVYVTWTPGAMGATAGATVRVEL